jgi:hypothetical protein
MCTIECSNLAGLCYRSESKDYQGIQMVSINTTRGNAHKNSGDMPCIIELHRGRNQHQRGQKRFGDPVLEGHVLLDE